MLSARSVLRTGYTLSKILGSRQRRYAIWWLRSLRQDYLLHEPLPWICFGAIEFIKVHLLSGMHVFEYGSGASTLFWLKHGIHVTSIEHDPGWYHKLRENYLRAGDIDYRLVPPERTEQKNLDCADPDAYTSGSEIFWGYTFQNYCSQIDEFPDSFFDLVVVDGRARASCIKHAHHKVKVGGLLVLDNSDRDYYLKIASAFLQNYERITFSGVTPGALWPTETSVFIRKA